MILRWFTGAKRTKRYQQSNINDDTFTDDTDIHSLMMMQPILSTCLFTSITDVTVDNNTDFGSTFLVNDDGTDDDNNINTIQWMISSPMIAKLL